MEKSDKRAIPIFVVSGSKGVAGHRMVRSLMIQYPENSLIVKIIPDVHSEKKILDVIGTVKQENGILSHTMVNSDLRHFLIEECKKQQVRQVDFMGDLADFIENDFGLQSVKTPGLYRKMNAQYYKRIEAIEYTRNHDDGLNTRKLHEAEIILTGVSRSGKTPLSIYMSMFGWKVANVPLVYGIDPPKELFEIDKNRVFGLNINLSHLIVQRQKRLNAMGDMQNKDYVDAKLVGRELQNAKMVIKRGGFTKINVTNKAIESTANEIIGLVFERFENDNRIMTNLQ